jgi:hypothetical protein
LGILRERESRSRACYVDEHRLPINEGSLVARSQTRRIITSVDLIRAAAVCPAFRFISRADRAVMIEVICCSPIEITTSAMSPLTRTLHKLRGQGTKQFSITALHQVLGLVELNTRTSSFPWAKP